MRYSRQPRDYYEALGLRDDASFREIEAAYWRHARHAHGRDLDLLNEAYEALGNDRRRREYDEQRGRYLTEQPEAASQPAPARLPRSRLADQFGAR